MRTEDGKISTLSQLAERGHPDDLSFLIEVSVATSEPWIIRAETFRFLLDTDLEDPVLHAQMTVALRSALEREQNITVQQYAAFCVGPFLDDEDLRRLVQNLLLVSEDLRWNLMEAICEEETLSAAVQHMLHDVQEKTSDQSLRTEIAEVLRQRAS
ncbi:hypothetical protein GCM10008949_53610 [Deinococcus humi]|nr:hypothetical protein GCM10008949_53610 [Deinococcus humi]